MSLPAGDCKGPGSQALESVLGTCPGMSWFVAWTETQTRSRVRYARYVRVQYVRGEGGARVGL